MSLNQRSDFWIRRIAAGLGTTGDGFEGADLSGWSLAAEATGGGPAA